MKFYHANKRDVIYMHTRARSFYSFRWIWLFVNCLISILTIRIFKIFEFEFWFYFQILPKPCFSWYPAAAFVNTPSQKNQEEITNLRRNFSMRARGLGFGGGLLCKSPLLIYDDFFLNIMQIGLEAWWIFGRLSSILLKSMEKHR